MEEKHVGPELRALRVAQGSGLGELARRSGVAKSTLSAWENGLSRPNASALEPVLDVLGVGAREKARLLAQTRSIYARVILPESPLGAPVSTGQVLRAMRKRRGISQWTLATSVGVNQSTVARWERGEMEPTPESLHAACFALGAAPEELAALSSATSGAPEETSDFESRWAAIERLPSDLQRVAFLGLETDLWKRAVRDATWDGPLARTISGRAYTYRLDCRTDEIAGVARPAVELARTSGVWKQATAAFMAGMALRPARHGERVAALDLWMEQLPESSVERLWLQGVKAETLARMGAENKGIDLAWRTLDRLAPHWPSEEVDERLRLSLADVRLAAGNAAAALDLLAEDERPVALRLRSEALIKLGQKPPEEWIERLRRHIDAIGMAIDRENLERIERSAARIGRKRPKS